MFNFKKQKEPQVINEEPKNELIIVDTRSKSLVELYKGSTYIGRIEYSHILGNQWVFVPRDGFINPYDGYSDPYAHKLSFDDLQKICKKLQELNCEQL